MIRVNVDYKVKKMKLIVEYSVELEMVTVQLQAG